jgi:hypothetical protein
MLVNLLGKICQYTYDNWRLYYQLECLYHIKATDIITLTFGIGSEDKALALYFLFPYELDLNLNRPFNIYKQTYHAHPNQFVYYVQSFKPSEFDDFSEIETQSNQKILMYISQIAKLFSFMSIGNSIVSDKVDFLGNYENRINIWTPESMEEVFVDSDIFAFNAFTNETLDRFPSYSKQQSRYLE